MSHFAHQHLNLVGGKSNRSTCRFFNILDAVIEFLVDGSTFGVVNVLEDGGRTPTFLARLVLGPSPPHLERGWFLWDRRVWT